MNPYDLHCHSTHSDGLLSPDALVRRAAERGVQTLALTDHDEISGLNPARSTAVDCGIRFIDGVEISVSWRDLTLHIVGLRIDPKNQILLNGLEKVRSGRSSRGRRIGESLAEVGIPNAFEGAMRYVTSEKLISRTHFARFLVEAGYVKEVKDVFKHYLTPGKPGYIEHEWATMLDAIEWIHGAGGQAVLAHPGRYKVDSAGMNSLLNEFKALNGDAIEVLTSSHTYAQYSEYAAYAKQFDLLASCGSDYHGPGESWMDFGQLPALPIGLTPVWKEW